MISWEYAVYDGFAVPKVSQYVAAGHHTSIALNAHSTTLHIGGGLLSSGGKTTFKYIVGCMFWSDGMQYYTCQHKVGGKPQLIFRRIPDAFKVKLAATADGSECIVEVRDAIHMVHITDVKVKPSATLSSLKSTISLVLVSMQIVSPQQDIDLNLEGYGSRVQVRNVLPIVRVAVKAAISADHCVGDEPASKRSRMENTA
jgi:hypothetical protein